jgi:glycosyltransferase involved in cell wall biosynthesis
MKILWFTNTPSNASALFGYENFGGGWISALETILVNENKHELGICFFYEGNGFKKVEKDNVCYYGIPLKKQNSINRIISRYSGGVNDESEDYIEQVLQYFNPQLIHVFGTEQGYGRLLVNRFEKVVFHLQGLIAPYSEVYFPPGFSKTKALLYAKLNSTLRGLTFYNGYLSFKHMGERELETMRQWKYYSGRTMWDSNYTYLLNPAATYFHCEELLRPAFFDNKWLPQDIRVSSKNLKPEIIIATTINPNIYKGLDLIYKVIPLLRNYNVEWRIFGLSEENDLNRIVKRMLGIKKPLQSIRFYGQLDASNLIVELKSCHIFVHPSYIDNSPNSVCEAMLLGIPVVSSAVGGINSLIIHQETGYLINPHDKYDLAGMIAHLCVNYQNAIACGARARERALARHNPVKILETLNNMYNTIYND